MQFSIIIPVYNVEKYLEKCLDSIIHQQFHDYEIILIDDGSTDHSGEICDNYNGKYDNILVTHIQNHGVSFARNEGLKVAKGKYIWFIDSDDYIEEGALQIINKYICADPEIDLFVFDAIVRNNKDQIKKIITCDKISTKKMCFSDNRELIYLNTSLWNRVYKRKVISDNNLIFDEEITIAEDLLFNYMYMLECSGVMYIKEKLYNYIVRKNSAMQGTGRDEDVQKAFDKLVCCYEEKGVYQNYKKEVDYLVYNHVYLVTMVRMIRNSVEKECLNNVRVWLKERNLSPMSCNKYIRNMPIQHIILLLLLKLKCYWVVEMLFKKVR